MKYCAIFHANLNYAYLLPEKYEYVIRNSYELIVDTMREQFPTQKYVFEASGFTIDKIAELCPDVMAKFKAAVDAGQCEFMGSPYAHLMMSNFPEDMDIWSLEFSQEAYERHLGKRLVSGWNPECGWMSYVPHAFQKTGFKQITLDFEGYSLSSMPEVRAVEYNSDKGACYGLDLPWYDLPGDEKALHFPFKNIVPGLNGFTRSDRLCQPALRWLMGMYPFEQYMDPIRKYSKKDEGCLIVFAEDAEYIGTAGWYFMKYYKQYDRLFERMPDAKEKFCHFMNVMQDEMNAEFISFDSACNDLPAVEKPFYVEDGLAWHRAWSIAWTYTPEAKEFDPIVMGLRDKALAAQQTAKNPADRARIRQAWYHITSAANSDGRWPPPPDLVCPFNKEWVAEQIALAQKVLVDF